MEWRGLGNKLLNAVEVDKRGRSRNELNLLKSREDKVAGFHNSTVSTDLIVLLS